jgi:hypothetical protein
MIYRGETRRSIPETDEDDALPRTGRDDAPDSTKETTMKLSRTLQIAAATAVCTAAAAQSALAGGEPKNTSPFTRPVTPARSSTAGVIMASAIASARAAIVGEAKSERPFTFHLKDIDALGRFLSHTSTTIAGEGEPKNEPPFTLHVGRGA